MKFKKLREKRLLLQNEMSQLIDAADTEERAMTEEESNRFSEIEQEIAQIDATIATEERARNLNISDENNNNDSNGSDDNVEHSDMEVRAFENYIRGVVEERADANLTVADNGAVIPTSIANKIIQKVVTICPIFQDAERYNIKGTLTIPYYDESSGDIAMSYMDEFVDDGESTSGKIKNITLQGYLGRAITDVSKSLLNNSSFNLLDFVIDRMALSISRFVEHELLIGTSGKIEGLSGVTNVKVAASPTAVTSDELIELQETVPDVYQASAYWIMNKATRTAIRKFKDGQGNYLLNKDANSRWGYTLFGKDVYTSDNMPTMKAGAKAIYYGDMKGLAVKVSEDINIEVLRETKARQHVVEVLGFIEFDAKVQNGEMIAALQMKASS